MLQLMQFYDRKADDLQTRSVNKRQVSFAYRRYHLDIYRRTRHPKIKSVVRARESGTSQHLPLRRRARVNVT